MNTYTYSEARQQLTKVLDDAARDGAVQITRRDGQVFLLQSIKDNRSPLDVPSVKLNKKITKDEIVSLVREGREQRCD
ncbi:MAG: type II toxin-antitoxin system Phd/YefM family antitoxin [Deinococcota bacterium]